MLFCIYTKISITQNLKKMAKYLIETFYNCSIKVSHYLDKIDDNEIQNLEKRDDGKFEILDIKLDKRNTKNLNKKITIDTNNKNVELKNSQIKNKKNKQRY